MLASFIVYTNYRNQEFQWLLYDITGKVKVFALEEN